MPFLYELSGAKGPASVYAAAFYKKNYKYHWIKEDCLH